MVRMSSRMLTDVNHDDDDKFNIKTVERGSDGYTCVPALKRWAAQIQHVHFGPALLLTQPFGNTKKRRC